MKKIIVVFVALVLLIAGGVWYALSGAGEFIRVQIEQQGSQHLETSVSVAKVDLAITEGRMTISDLDIKNPQGYSEDNAFSLGAITLDLGEVVNEPYVIQTISIDAPEVLYEIDGSGQGNLLVLKNNLTANLPKTQYEPAAPSQDSANPLVMVENVTVSNVRFRLNLEKLDTGDVNIETKSFDVTLPTFNAGAIGKPSGIPADQVGLAVVDAMLDNLIAAAKEETKKRIKEAAKKKAKEALDKHKDKLLDKAGDKLKGLFD